jgi:hypothetical protein
MMMMLLLLGLLQFLDDVCATWEAVAGFYPTSQITDYNAMDLDQAALEIALGRTIISYTEVKNIYEQGGNSGSYAEFSVPALTSALKTGSPVVGMTSGVEGKVFMDSLVGETTIRVAYRVSSEQATYVNCKEGMLFDPPTGTAAALMPDPTNPYRFLGGCFQEEDLKIIDDDGDLVVRPIGPPTNKAGRTLKSFSSKAGATMYAIGPNGGCAGASDRSTDGCPYFDFTMYYNYYGDFAYADKFVTAAIDAKPTTFTKGGAGNMDMDFTKASDAVRVQCIKKGTAYMHVFMYVIRKFESAIDNCKAGIQSSSSVPAWDAGVALYTGSLEGTKEGGSSAGKFLYRLAEKRCQNYKTCGKNHDSTSGTSYVNIELLKQFFLGQHTLLKGDCEAARPILSRITALMSIPLIQGSMRYTYKVDKLGGGDTEKGEAAVFTAAIIPRVAHCSPVDAEIIMKNSRIGAHNTSHAAVKTAFENNYACMNITCEEVGGLWFSTEGKFYTGADPCTSRPPQAMADNSDGVGADIMILAAVAIGVVCLCLLFLCVVFCIRTRTRQTNTCVTEIDPLASVVPAFRHPSTRSLSDLSQSPKLPSHKDTVSDTSGISTVNLSDGTWNEDNPRPLPEGKHFHFFLSHKKAHSQHGRRSEQIAESLKDILEVKGFKGFIDIDALDNISKEALEYHVERSCTLIVLLHDETCDSEWCRFEWDIARREGLPVKCVVDAQHFGKDCIIEQVSRTNDHLLAYQWIEFMDKYRKHVVHDLAEWLVSKCGIEALSCTADFITLNSV